MFLDFTDTITQTHLIVHLDATRLELTAMSCTVYTKDGIIDLYPHGSNKYEVEVDK